ncbi:MAG: nitrous oxide reductase accessory protein NosL [Magnetococcales bacterium]|nr:nitrous oxide reductase accessory protein NosL [Magnetococcales bacterium]
MKWSRWSLIFLILLTACAAPQEGTPPPLEPAGDTKGYYCGMNLAEHVGPKGQIHVAGEPGALWFSSMRDAFAYLRHEGKTRRILAFYVNDMGRAEWDHPQPGTWIEAREAHFVLGASRSGGMGTVELIPFGTPSAAQDWVRRHGGRVMVYGEAAQTEW